jgi:succinoglycan biosynthesis transport protein ExoP
MDSGPLVQANSVAIRELQPAAAFDVGRSPRLYSDLPPQESAVGEYFRVLVKRKWIVVGCLLTIFTVVAIATLRQVPIYEANGSIAVKKPDSSLNFKDTNAISFDYYDPTELETEVKILQSDLLALQVIKELNLDRQPEFGGKSPAAALPSSLDLAPDPLEADPSRTSSLLSSFKGRLTISLLPNSRIMSVRFRDPDPQTAQNVVNKLMSDYQENNYKTRFNNTMQVSDWLGQQLVDLQMKVETSQEKLVRYQKEHEILGIDEKQNITTAKLDELNRALTLAESERMDKEAFYHLVESGDPDAIASGGGGPDGPGTGQSGSPLLESLRTKQAELKIQIADLNTQFGPSYPKLAQLNNQLAEIEVQLQSEMKKIASKVKGQYTTALGREDLLSQALEKQKQAANKLNESAIEYSLLKRDLETNRQLYEGLLEKLKEAGISEGLKSNNFQIVNSARVPTYPVEPNVPRNLGFAFVLGLTSGVGLAFLLEGLDNTVRTTEQAQAISGLPPLGMIPLGSKTTREGSPSKRLILASSNEAVELITHVRPQSQMAESYRALRTSLLLSHLGAPPKVIMVTSALPQEGKSTTSINCAVVLAQKGVRVLLIDCDLRRPSIHKTLGMGPRSGLSNVLTGSTTLKQAITVAPTLPNLDVLPAGTPPPNPAELLASANMRDVLAELREKYDHIVLDTPPTLSVTDAVVLSPRADAIVLVIRSGSTTKQALRRSRDILMQVNARVSGVLLNAVDLSSPDYYYYYEYQGKYAQYYHNHEASSDEEDPEAEPPASSSSA